MYPHQASLKNMPGHDGNRTYTTNLRFETCNFTQNFPFCQESFNLIPTILIKQLVLYGNSATLIDNIFVNNTEHDIRSGNIISDISDHFSQFCITSTFKKKFIFLFF